MIEDVIDESPATRGLLQSSSNYTSARSFTIDRSPATSDFRSKPIDLDLDLDVSGSSSKIQASMDDIDDDEFFLGPGNKTYKVSSSSGGPKYTEPINTSMTKTYDDLSTTSYNSSSKRTSETHNGVHKEQSKSYLNGHSFKSIQNDLSDLSDDSDELTNKDPLQNGNHYRGEPAAKISSQSSRQVAERRDSIGSDSTDYILIQAEQHLKHGAVVEESHQRIKSEPPPPPPPARPVNKHVTGTPHTPPHTPTPQPKPQTDQLGDPEVF